MTPPTAPERCPTCDKPKGDQARADALPIVRAWVDKPSSLLPPTWSEVQAAQAADQPGTCIDGQCRPKDWRAAYESIEPAAAQWAKVAPLIEAMRDCSINDGDDPQELEALRNELIAATEATP